MSTMAVLATILLAFSMWQPVVLGYLELGGVAMAPAIVALYLGSDVYPNRPDIYEPCS
jgi:hypothetical protein